MPYPRLDEIHARVAANLPRSDNVVLNSINTPCGVAARNADHPPVRQFLRELDEAWLPSTP